MKDIKTKVLINLIHTNTGGGLIYLNNILPFLVNNKNFDIYIICQKKYRDRLELPKSVTVKEVNIIGGFYMVLLWEQFILPIIAWKIRAKATLCNAGFAPIFSPNPIIIIHNNARMFFFR